jgi:hypothetical protein
VAPVSTINNVGSPLTFAATMGQCTSPIGVENVSGKSSVMRGIYALCSGA